MRNFGYELGNLLDEYQLKLIHVRIKYNLNLHIEQILSQKFKL